MPRQPYRMLRFVLAFLALIVGVGGLMLIFGGRPFLSQMILRPAESEVSTLLLFVAKEMGGVLLLLSILLSFAFS